MVLTHIMSFTDRWRIPCVGKSHISAGRHDRTERI